MFILDSPSGAGEPGRPRACGRPGSFPGGAACPIFTKGDGSKIDVGDLYRGAAVFLLLNGPSLAELDLERVKRPGLLSAALNNGTRRFRPDLWFSCDKPVKFLNSVWKDPRVTKFARSAYRDLSLRRLTDEATADPVRHCPNVIFFESKARFRPESFFDMPFVSFGSGRARSTMVAAFRILYMLGVREIYLLGCDFHMEKVRPYHFSEPVTARYISNNNRAYERLRTLFERLQPYLLERDLRVYNCNPRSRLEVFPYADFDETVERLSEPFARLARLEDQTAFY